MTIDEYINNNLPFFHITKESNLEAILQEGLSIEKSFSRKGICVIRQYCHENEEWPEELVYEVIDTQLNTVLSRESKFALIKLTPYKHCISATDVVPDPIQEPNSSMYNYICKNIIIENSDIIKYGIRIGNFKPVTRQAEKLDGYKQTQIGLSQNFIKLIDDK
ncbi:MAG: hypothetical protein KBT27_07360 [Prevotellaceae bacterium]|nr:hypothetical protein [Candidatus Faecinaster equi]